MDEKKIKLVLAATGGSGSGYFLRLLYHLVSISGETHWMASDNFFIVMNSEYGMDFSDIPYGNCTDEIIAKISEIFPKNDKNMQHQFYRHDYRDISAAPASGSVHYDGMIILPCSMKTLGAIANGISSNLIERSADVSLKEKRRLLLVPRETPYNLIHIENMRILALSGAIVMPASPGFYHRPKTINDLFDFIIDRIFYHMGIEKRIIPQWNNKT